MKIVHVIWSLNIGGAETLLANLANEQALLGETVTLIIINNSYDNEILNSISKNVNIVLLNRRPGSKSPIPILKLNYILFRLKPQIIHTHVGSIIDYISKSLHHKCVLTMHTTGIVTDRKSLKKYARIFAISNSVKTVLSEKFNIKSTTITNGVVFNKILCREEPSDNGCFKIVNIGRLVDNIKGQSTLIKAISIIPNNLNITADIIGDGPDMQMLKDLSKELSVENRVNLIGARSQQYLHNHMKSYDLLVQPSFIEGFGLTIVEGMAAKLPVLVSDIDGTSEVVCNGKYGTIFKVGDHVDLAEKIIDIMNKRNYLKEVVDKAYTYAEKEYSLAQTARKYIKNYELLN